MCDKKNEEVARIVKWARQNIVIWDFICEPELYDFSIGDCIDILKKLDENNMNQLILVLLRKLRVNQYVEMAVNNVIENRIIGDFKDSGIIKELIKELEDIAKKENVLNERIMKE